MRPSIGTFVLFYLGLHMTYFSFDWLAMEYSIIVNWGNGADKYFDFQF